MAASYCCPFISSSAFCSSACSSLVFTPASAPTGPVAPGARGKATGGIGAPIVRTGTRPDCGWNPGAEAVIFQVPDFRPMIEYRPLSSVVAVNEEGHAWGFRAVAVAPLRAGLVVFFTVPPTRPVWAEGGAPETTHAA